MAELVGHVAQLWQYPVKSMGGVTLSAADVQKDGLVGDRGWCAREEELGQLTVVRRTPQLLKCRAQYESEPRPGAVGDCMPSVRVTLPDGESFSTRDPDAAERLSNFIGKPLSLWPRQPKRRLGHYRLAKPQGARELKRQFASKTLPDLSSIPLSRVLELMLFVTPLGRYQDVYPLHILSSAAIAHMRRQDPEADFRVERFRPNLYIQSVDDGAGLDDFSWVRGELSIGEVVLACDSRTVRCSAPSQPQSVMEQDGLLERDGRVLSALGRETGRHLGINALVKRTGRVSVGDPVYFDGKPGITGQRLSRYDKLRNRVLHAGLETVDRLFR
ncbi:MAG: MOSC N-terminal beta barrel domain-containing protein [Pseudomonadota bacterium]